MKQVIVISGGSDGLGLELVKALSGDYQVVALARNQEKLHQLAQDFGCDYRMVDVTKYDQVMTAANSLVEQYGRVDVLINNAGIWLQGELDTNHPDDISRVIAVNTLGTIYLTRALLPVMKQQQSGLIINVISQAGLYGKPERSVYHASKFAITGFTKSLEMEVARYGIRVTGLYPGLMKTNLFEKTGNHRDLSMAVEVDQVVKTVSFILGLDDTTLIPELGIKRLG